MTDFPRVRLLIEKLDEPTYVEIEMPGGGVIAGHVTSPLTQYMLTGSDPVPPEDASDD